jgi:hypothetical protein
MLCLSMECYIKRAHLQCVVIAICKSASVEEDRLEACALQVLEWMLLIIMNYFRDPQLG